MKARYLFNHNGHVKNFLNLCSEQNHCCRGACTFRYLMHEIRNARGWRSVGCVHCGVCYNELGLTNHSAFLNVSIL